MFISPTGNAPLGAFLMASSNADFFKAILLTVVSVDAGLVADIND